jgi:hypothetical protein
MAKTTFIDPNAMGGGGKEDRDVRWVALDLLLNCSKAYAMGDTETYNRGIRVVFNMLFSKYNRNKDARKAIEDIEKEYNKLNVNNKNINIKELETQKYEEIHRQLMILLDSEDENVTYEA